MSKNQFDAFGYILKEENYEKLVSKVMPNTTVLENVGAYPGYYGSDMPQKTSIPGHLFFIQKKEYTWEELMRKTHKIKRFFDGNFVMNQATLSFGNKSYPAIRIKKLDSYDKIAQLQSAYVFENILFEKNIPTPKEALTKVRKYFVIEELNENIWADLEEKDIHYLRVPHFTNWEFFRKITNIAKSNLGPGFMFDAAMGVIYRRDYLYDVLRIYAPDMDEKMLLHIQSTYVNQFEHFSS